VCYCFRRHGTLFEKKKKRMMTKGTLVEVVEAVA
jgi:hypothetical protein